MTIEFQESLLKYLFQNKEAKQYKDYLEPGLFDIPTCQTVYDLWFKYVTRFKQVPTKTYFLEYVDRAIKKSKGAVSPEQHDEILTVVSVVYMPDAHDILFVREVIIEFAKRKRLRNWTLRNAEKIKTADSEAIDAMLSDANQIVRLGEDTSQNTKNRGGFLFRDGARLTHEHKQKGAPTFLHSLNRLTSARGFYSPQLIGVMGGPKAFKTGTILAILIEYARCGKKVFIADAENGVDSMQSRIKQGLLGCEYQDIQKYRRELKEILRILRLYGGDVVVEFFPARISTLDNVDAALDRLWEEEKWKPDIIFYDYLQLFASSNKKIVENTQRIQDVYHHAIRLNNKWGAFAFTAIPVTRSAVSKLHVTADDLASDFGQAYNCHAGFALCRTPEEVTAGNGRLIPVFQREGTAYKFNAATTCALRIKEAEQTIEELDAEAYMEVMEETHKPKKLRKPYVPNLNLKDE